MNINWEKNLSVKVYNEDGSEVSADVIPEGFLEHTKAALEEKELKIKFKDTMNHVSNLAFGQSCNKPDIGMRRLIGKQNPYDQNNKMRSNKRRLLRTYFPILPLDPSMLVRIQCATNRYASYLCTLAFHVYFTVENSIIKQFVRIEDEKTKDPDLFISHKSCKSVLCESIDEYVAYKLPQHPTLVPPYDVIPYKESNDLIKYVYKSICNENLLDVPQHKYYDTYMHEAITKSFMQGCYHPVLDVQNVERPLNVALAKLYKRIVEDVPISIDENFIEEASLVAFIESHVIGSVAKALGYLEPTTPDDDASPIKFTHEDPLLAQSQLQENEDPKDSTQQTHKTKLKFENQIESESNNSEESAPCANLQYTERRQMNVQNKNVQNDENSNNKVMQKIAYNKDNIQIEQQNERPGKITTLHEGQIESDVIKNSKKQMGDDLDKYLIKMLHKLGITTLTSGLTNIPKTYKKVQSSDDVEKCYNEIDKIETKFCETCFKPGATKRCRKCLDEKVAFPHVYCRRECQEEAWRTGGHREFHKSIKACKTLCN